MKIPKEITIFSQKIKIKVVKNLRTKHGALGLCDPEASVIYIQASTKEFPISKDKKEQIFFHELQHMMMHYAGRDELNAEEHDPFIDVLGSQMRQIFEQLYSSK